MNQNEILKNVDKLIRQVKKEYKSSILLDTRFVEDIEMDSLDGMEVIGLVEEALGVEISEKELPRFMFKTVGEFVAFLENKFQMKKRAD